MHTAAISSTRNFIPPQIEEKSAQTHINFLEGTLDITNNPFLRFSHDFSSLKNIAIFLFLRERILEILFSRACFKEQNLEDYYIYCKSIGWDDCVYPIYLMKSRSLGLHLYDYQLASTRILQNMNEEVREVLFQADQILFNQEEIDYLTLYKFEEAKMDLTELVATFIGDFNLLKDNIYFLDEFLSKKIKENQELQLIPWFSTLYTNFSEIVQESKEQDKWLQDVGSEAKRIYSYAEGFFDEVYIERKGGLKNWITDIYRILSQLTIHLTEKKQECGIENSIELVNKRIWKGLMLLSNIQNSLDLFFIKVEEYEKISHRISKANEGFYKKYLEVQVVKSTYTQWYEEIWQLISQKEDLTVVLSSEKIVSLPNTIYAWNALMQNSNNDFKNQVGKCLSQFIKISQFYEYEKVTQNIIRETFGVFIKHKEKELNQLIREKNQLNESLNISKRNIKRKKGGKSGDDIDLYQQTRISELSRQIDRKANDLKRFKVINGSNDSFSRMFESSKMIKIIKAKIIRKSAYLLSNTYRTELFIQTIEKLIKDLGFTTSELYENYTISLISPDIYPLLGRYKSNLSNTKAIFKPFQMSDQVRKQIHDDIAIYCNRFTMVNKQSKKNKQDQPKKLSQLKSEIKEEKRLIKDSHPKEKLAEPKDSSEQENRSIFKLMKESTDHKQCLDEIKLSPSTKKIKISSPTQGSQSLSVSSLDTKFSSILTAKLQAYIFKYEPNDFCIIRQFRGDGSNEGMSLILYKSFFSSLKNSDFVLKETKLSERVQQQVFASTEIKWDKFHQFAPILEEFDSFAVVTKKRYLTEHNLIEEADIHTENLDEKTWIVYFEGMIGHKILDEKDLFFYRQSQESHPGIWKGNFVYFIQENKYSGTYEITHRMFHESRSYRQLRYNALKGYQKNW